MPYSSLNSKIKIDMKKKVIFARLSEFFDEQEAKNLTSYLDLVGLETKIFKNIFILPEKWKSTHEGRKILKEFKRKTNNLIVAPSPIQRAFLKTEAVFDGESVEYICKTQDEALDKLNSLD
ncbi:MAG: hypothetical protein EAX96_13685 [Candidatus Lokiarchaeota archaeon]|nr:hypothetical protein [Candidatus Lokiarchaeota archaeon]